MQVNNQAVSNQIKTNDRPLELKQGEVYQTTIKERKGTNEAILSIRGKEIHAKFEGTLPSGDRVTVQVGETKDQIVQVRAVTETPSRSQSIEQRKVTDSNQVLRNLGAGPNPSPELRQAAQLLLDKGVPLTKEAVRELKAYITETKGTTELKLNTIEALANKRLEITQTHLRAIHEALHGRPLNQLLTDLVKDLDPGFGVNRNGESDEAYQRIAREVLQQVNQNLGSVEEVVKLDTKVEGQRSSEIIKQLITQVQQEAHLQKATEQIRGQFSNLGQESFEHIDRMIDQAIQLKQQGRELAARQHLIHQLTEMEQDLVKQVSNVDSRALASEQQQQQYMVNDLFQSQPISSKDLMVNTVTQKLSEAAINFKVLKREITRNLDNVERVIQHSRTNSFLAVKPMLESIIQKLDNAILKSDMMLLTDMKTEKQLMQASGQLAEAKKLLTKGNHQAAERIVHDVKGMVEKIIFKPSETKIVHFIKESQQVDHRPVTHQLLQQFEETARRSNYPEPSSARQVYEMVRSMGLNRESEVGQFLTSKEQGQQDANQRNMKAVLMQLLQNEELQGRAADHAKQALNNLTGQQLLSKSDPSHLQTMLFNLPVLLEEQVENLQVYVNSRNEGEEVDWENCSLYFLINTKKLGDVGIMVTVTDRNLSLTLKNDMPFFKEKMVPLAGNCKEQLEEIGYNIGSINVTKMNLSKAPQKVMNQLSTGNDHSEKQSTMFTEKGFDLKI